jgi:hypothetical protein
MDKRLSNDKWNYWDDLPENEADAIIEEMAQTIVKRKLSLAGSLLLQGIYPLTRIGSELGLAFLGPYLEFFGTAKHAAIFRKKIYVQRLINRIEELEDETRSNKKS